VFYFFKEKKGKGANRKKKDYQKFVHSRCFL